MQDQDIDQRLIAALKAQDVQAVEELLKQGADADARVQNERAPLFMAVESKNLALVKLVAACAKDVNIQDDCDFTPFTQAVRMELQDIAQALLDNGALPFPPGRGSHIPLDWAIFRGQHAITARLLSAGPDCLYKERPVLVYAAEQGDIALAQVCIAAGADVNLSESKNGNTALHLAARRGDAPFIQLLIQSGASEHVEDAQRSTALDLARSSGNGRIFESIILERDMRRAAVALTEGAPEKIAVGRPLKLQMPKI